jgi:hypothetical protein
MGTALLWLGRAGGVAGLLLSLGAILLRARGVYNFAGFQIGTLLLAGIAAMVAGCLGYLAALVERPGQ